jgi:hypothetical protein
MRRGRLLAAALAISAAACQEKLTAPGECPGLCPSGTTELLDEVVAGERDTTYTGFVQPGQGISLLVANGVQGEQSRGLVRFIRRGDSILVQDTLREMTIDSVNLSIFIQDRDRTVPGLQVEVFKLPATITVDAATAFADVEAALTPDRRLALIGIPDTLTRGAVFGHITGDIAFAPEDDGVLRLAYRLVSPTPTSVRIGSGNSGGEAPGFITYARVAVEDTTLQRQVVPRIVAFSSFVGVGGGPAPDPTALVAGGVPSSRALLRFTLPPRIRDSAQIVRATLQLVPLVPVRGLLADTAELDVRGILSDLDAKSPRLSNEGRTVFQALPAEATDTIRVDVTNIVELWQTQVDLPSALFLGISPEASSFTVGVFGSAESPPGFRPSLRITYALPFSFEAQ